MVFDFIKKGVKKVRDKFRAPQCPKCGTYMDKISGWVCTKCGNKTASLKKKKR